MYLLLCSPDREYCESRLFVDVRWAQEARDTWGMFVVIEKRQISQPDTGGTGQQSSCGIAVAVAGWRRLVRCDMDDDPGGECTGRG